MVNPIAPPEQGAAARWVRDVLLFKMDDFIILQHASGASVAEALPRVTALVEGLAVEAVALGLLTLAEVRLALGYARDWGVLTAQMTESASAAAQSLSVPRAVPDSVAKAVEKAPRDQVYEAFDAAIDEAEAAEAEEEMLTRKAWRQVKLHPQQVLHLQNRIKALAPPAVAAYADLLADALANPARWNTDDIRTLFRIGERLGFPIPDKRA